MAIAKMKLVNIVGRLRDFDTVVRNCCISGNFHPEHTTAALEGYEEFVPIEEPNPYSSHLRMAVDIGLHSDIKLEYHDFSCLNLSDDELSAYVAKTQKEIDVLNNKWRDCTLRVAHLEQGIAQLEHIRDFDVNLDELFNSNFVNYRFGKLPKDSYAKLDLYDNEDLLIFFPLGEDSEYFWGFYVTLKNNAEKTDEVFTSLYFERVDIIEEAHGTPSEAIENIRSLLTASKTELTNAKKAVDDYWKSNRDTYLMVYSKLKYLSDSFDLRHFAAKCGDSFYIFGWVPDDEIKTFKKQFDKMKYTDCIIENEAGAENFSPPTKLINRSINKPFETYIQMYGLPAYNEIDPTPLMALVYSLVFGVMFGDFGQGVLILLVALWMKIKKKMQLGGIMIRCSLFSMLFGILYNSVFGYENVFPFTVLPVHNQNYVNYILLSAVFFGVFMIVACMVVNIINGIRQKDLAKCLFGNNGFAGIVFYLSAVLSVAMFMMLQKNILSPLIIIFLIVLPLILMALKEPLAKLLQHKKDWMPKKKGDFIIQSLFELFEILLSYLSNTISYIRVGAFVLSHAGMMTAVFAISEIGGHGQNLIAIVIGNIFVIALEGLIVGIQGLRLQFYEMFSRFYEGSGKPYEPVKIKYNI